MRTFFILPLMILFLPKGVTKQELVAGGGCMEIRHPQECVHNQRFDAGETSAKVNWSHRKVYS